MTHAVMMSVAAVDGTEVVSAPDQPMDIVVDERPPQITAERRAVSSMVDQILEQSFPASDPPAWWGGPDGRRTDPDPTAGAGDGPNDPGEDRDPERTWKLTFDRVLEQRAGVPMVFSWTAWRRRARRLGGALRPRVPVPPSRPAAAI